jgi:hypothetical protein
MWQTAGSMQSGGVPYNVGHLLMPFLGARFYTSLGLEHFVGREWVSPFSFPLNLAWWGITGVTGLAYLLSWHGIYLAAREVKRGIGRTPPLSDLRYHGSLVALLALGFQIAMSFVFHLIPIPNFHSPLWFVYLYFIALSLSSLSLPRWCIQAYVGLLALGCAAFLILVHVQGGSRWHHYGPTLGNFLEVAKTLNRYGEKVSYRNEVPMLDELPYILPALRKLVGPVTPLETLRTPLVLRYLHPDNLRDARVTLGDNLRH